MKRSEQRWMHIESGTIHPAFWYPCDEVKDNYHLVTVTWDEPEYEDVEVVQWACVDNGVVLSVHDTFEEARNWANQDKVGCNVIELKGIDRRRKPEPQAWEGEIIGQFWLPAEFEGKKVRIEVIP